MTDLLRISGLTVRYGATMALSDLDLTIRDGELFVLLGGSGSGKTTLLRAIAGFVRPASGRIELDGQDLAPLPPHRRPVNTMFQSYALFPHMTVAANVAFGLAPQRLTRARAAERVAAMLALVRLQGLEKRRPHQLSGGQQQRVALARALAPNPSLLLLDEPLSALDRGLRAETRAELMRLNRTLRTTFILVTHDQEEALGMADRIAIMRDGRLVQVGTAAELYEQPNSRFVAGFLGVANILPGVVADDGRSIALTGLALIARADHAGRPGPGWLAVRAERLHLTIGAGMAAAGAGMAAAEPPGRAADGNHLPGTLAEYAYTGELIVWTVRLANGATVQARQPLTEGLAGVRAAPGAEVTLCWRPDASILLSA